MLASIRSRLISGVLILSGLEGLGVLIQLVLTKSAEGGILFGLSTTRLVIATAVLLISAFFLWLGFTWESGSKPIQRLHQTIDKHSRSLVFILTWGAILFLILQSETYYQLIFKPFKRLLSPELFPQLRPLMIWVCLILIQTAIGITFSKKDRFKQRSPQEHLFLVWLLLDLVEFLTGPDRSKLRAFWQRHKASLLIFIGMLLVWVFVAITGIGIEPDDRFWNIAGGPILWHQVVLTILLILLLLDLKQIGAGTRLLALTRKPAFPYILMALIWLTAVLIWQGQELRHTYFAVNDPPNYATYPFSDARWFDIGGQYFLMGEGLYNNQMTDRPYLMMYNAFLHILGGQHYETMIFFQILLLALIPAVIFLFLWKMHSTTAGFAAALLVILKEKNAINAANVTGLANPKMLTSELPNALLLILVMLCLYYWFRRPRRKALWPILAGGLTGLAVGFRGNSLTIIMLVPILALLSNLVQKKAFKQWVLASLFFLIGVTVVLAPYSIETTQKFGAPFWLVKIQNVIDRSEMESHVNEITSKLYRPAITPSEDGFVMLTLRHFLHNEITTVLMLPLRWQANSLDATLEHPIWDGINDWNGTLTLGEIAVLGANLLVLAFGIGFALQKWQITGLAPLGIHLAYNLTNSAARTSGGRYLVSTDWVLLLYFVLGIFALIYAFRGWKIGEPAESEFTSTSRGKFWLPALTLIGFLLLGSAHLFSVLITPQFDLASLEARQGYLNEELGRIENTGINPQEVQAFANTPGTVFSVGKALYPRYYQAGEAIPLSSHLPTLTSEEARLYFLMLEDLGPRHISISLPDDQVPSIFPHGEYGLILGCIKEGYTEGVLFIPLESPDSQIITQADLTLRCE